LGLSKTLGFADGNNQNLRVIAGVSLKWASVEAPVRSFILPNFPDRRRIPVYDYGLPGNVTQI
jgi:hypothetical protein